MLTGTVLAVIALAPIKVACLGDSITAGSGLQDPQTQSYPAYLQVALGDKYEVRNYGVGGRTLLRKGDTPYTETDQFQAAKDWAPRIAIVMLGTNDTVQGNRGNWNHHPDLTDDLHYITSQLKGAGTQITMIADPTPMFADLDSLNPQRKADLQERAPRLALLRFQYRNFAQQENWAHFPTLKKVRWTEDMVTDGVHLTPTGTKALAGALAKHIKVYQ